MAKELKPADIGHTVSVTLFFVLMAINIVNIHGDRKLSELRTGSIRREEVRLAADILRSNPAVEKLSKPTDDLSGTDSSLLWLPGAKPIDDNSGTDSWAVSDARLSGYADGFELLREQRRAENRFVWWMTLASVLSMVAFTFARKSRRSSRGQQDPAEQPATAGEPK